METGGTGDRERRLETLPGQPGAGDAGRRRHRDTYGSRGRIETRTGTTTETRYYIMGAELSPERFRHAVRGHWAIGNSLHWVLDVTMNEDRQRNRTGNGPENLALLRRMALNVARIEPGKDAMRGKLKRAGWDNNFLLDTIRSTKTPNPNPK